MGKAVISVVLSMLCVLSVSAQTERNDSTVRERIKEIKLEGKSLYADAVSLDGFEEARQMAVEELRIAVGSELAGMQTNVTSCTCAPNCVRIRLATISATTCHLLPSLKSHTNFRTAHSRLFASYFVGK